MRTLVRLLASAALALGLVGTLSASAGADDAEPATCCKVCRKGKACGDTCIARDKDCTVPPGCACDG